MVRLRTPPKVLDGGGKERNDTVTSRDKAVPHPHINCSLAVYNKACLKKKKKKNRSNFALKQSNRHFVTENDGFAFFWQWELCILNTPGSSGTKSVLKIFIFLPQLQWGSVAQTLTEPKPEALQISRKQPTSA